jgi:hypothetical protein
MTLANSPVVESVVIASKGIMVTDSDVAAVIRHWLGRGGLRADVLTDGTISAGDALEIVDHDGVIA